ncbi:hypothetical protein ACFL2D_01195 [Patescibacteria group bacterium]
MGRKHLKAEGPPTIQKIAGMEGLVTDADFAVRLFQIQENNPAYSGRELVDVRPLFVENCMKDLKMKIRPEQVPAASVCGEKNWTAVQLSARGIVGTQDVRWYFRFRVGDERFTSVNPDQQQLRVDQNGNITGSIHEDTIPFVFYRDQSVWPWPIFNVEPFVILGVINQLLVPSRINAISNLVNTDPPVQGHGLVLVKYLEGFRESLQMVKSRVFLQGFTTELWELINGLETTETEEFISYHALTSHHDPAVFGHISRLGLVLKRALANKRGSTSDLKHDQIYEAMSDV